MLNEYIPSGKLAELISEKLGTMVFSAYGGPIEKLAVKPIRPEKKLNPCSCQSCRRYGGLFLVGGTHKVKCHLRDLRELPPQGTCMGWVGADLIEKRLGIGQKILVEKEGKENDNNQPK